MKKYSVRFDRENINFNEINVANVECTGKSFFYVWMTFLFGGCSVVGVISLASEMLHSIQGVFAYIFINLIFIVPFIYNLLKIKNYCFGIKNDKILYKNILGTIYEYGIDEIKDIECIIRHRPETFRIKMENKKNIIVSDYLTNFDLLKLKFQKEKLI